SLSCWRANARCHALAARINDPECASTRTTEIVGVPIGGAAPTPGLIALKAADVVAGTSETTQQSTFMPGASAAVWQCRKNVPITLPPTCLSATATAWAAVTGGVGSIAAESVTPILLRSGAACALRRC